MNVPKEVLEAAVRESREKMERLSALLVGKTVHEAADLWKKEVPVGLVRVIEWNGESGFMDCGVFPWRVNVAVEDGLITRVDGVY